LGRGPKLEERRAAEEFLVTQAQQYSGNHEAKEAVWTDFWPMLLASNGFLYVE
jgi:hypothetical protein